MLFAPDWKRDTAGMAATEPAPAQAMFARWVADLLERGEHDAALRRAEVGTSRYPAYATGWYALARAQAACGMHLEATQSAERCLALESDFFAAWNLLAELWQQLNRPASARAARARLNEFLPDTVQTAEPAAPPATGAIPAPAAIEPPPQKLVLKRPAETARAFETPTLAELYRRQGLLDRALDVYRRILERHPNDAGAKTMVQKLEAELSSKRKPAETA